MFEFGAQDCLSLVHNIVCVWCTSEAWLHCGHRVGAALLAALLYLDLIHVRGAIQVAELHGGFHAALPALHGRSCGTATKSYSKAWTLTSILVPGIVRVPRLPTPRRV
jgi:hypothetical protein